MSRRRWGRPAAHYARCHQTRPQVAQPGTSYTSCALCTRHARRWWVRLAERVAQLTTEIEREARPFNGPAPTEAELRETPRARAYRRLIRLAWRTTRPITPADAHALEAGYRMKNYPTFAHVRREDVSAGTCQVCGVAFGYVEALRLPRMGSVLTCCDHRGEGRWIAERRLQAKYPQTTWRIVGAVQPAVEEARC